MMEDLKRKARDLEALIRIGKMGLTEGTVNEINKQLKKKKLIKIKFLKAFLDSTDKEEAISKIIDLTGSTPVEKKGNTLVLFRDG